MDWSGLTRETINSHILYSFHLTGLNKPRNDSDVLSSGVVILQIADCSAVVISAKHRTLHGGCYRAICRDWTPSGFSIPHTQVVTLDTPGTTGPTISPLPAPESPHMGDVVPRDYHRAAPRRLILQQTLTLASAGLVVVDGPMVCLGAYVLRPFGAWPTHFPHN